MTKPHLRIIKGRVFTFKSRGTAEAWAQEFGRRGMVPPNAPKTFREWKERKVRIAKYRQTCECPICVKRRTPRVYSDRTHTRRMLDFFMKRRTLPRTGPCVK